MAVAATVMGGFFGFVGFLISLLALDHSFVVSCGIYFGTGILTTLLIVTTCSLPRGGRPNERTAEDLTTVHAG